MNRMMTALTCAAATAFALSAAVPAHAESLPAEAQYTIEVRSPVENRGDEAASWSRVTTLDCDPAGGSHPRAEEACDLIAEHGDIASVQSAGDGVCTMIYQPVTARVTGAEEYEQTFSNACVMNNTKGEIFDF